MSTDENIEKLIENWHSQIIERIEYEDYLKNLPRPINLSQLTFLNDVKTRFKNRELVLVLGSGVSVSCGLPDWNNLLQIMLSKSFEKETKTSEVYSSIFDNVFKPNNIIIGRYLLKHHNNVDFITAIKDSLYPEKIIESKLVNKISNLCTITPELSQLDSIITYNYDDILEENIKLRNSSFLFRSIFDKYDIPRNNELLIYHVHGFIPRVGKGSIEDEIVFCENNYHTQYNNIYIPETG